MQERALTVATYKCYSLLLSVQKKKSLSLFKYGKLRPPDHRSTVGDDLLRLGLILEAVAAVR
jgi:hypothetical protein